MVKPKYLIIAGIILVAAGVIAWFVLSQSEESIIKNQFKAITKSIEKTAGESPIIAAANAGKLKESIISPCRILAPDYDVEKDISTDDISGFILAKKMQFHNLSITLHDFLIELTSETTASVSLTGKINGKLSNGKKVGDVHEYSCEMQKIDDIWMLKVIEIVEVLQE